MAESFRDKALRRLTEAERMLSLAKRLPDLHEHSDRWSTKRLFASNVNALTIDCLIKHSCGCCPDSPLEVWPFCEIDGFRVFSDPPCFTVGEQLAYRVGERPYPDWQGELRKAAIPEEIIAKVATYFEEHRPSDDDDE